MGSLHDMQSYGNTATTCPITLIYLLTSEPSKETMSENKPLTFNGRNIYFVDEFWANATRKKLSEESRNSVCSTAGCAVPKSFILCAVEVAIHTILFVRQVYPADVFVRRKKYETPVYQSRHPALNEYISGAVKAVRDEMELVSSQCDKHHS